MKRFPRITLDPAVMGGRPCIRGQRMTVASLLRLLAAGRTHAEILREFPFLEPGDIVESIGYAAWLTESHDEPLVTT